MRQKSRKITTVVVLGFATTAIMYLAMFGWMVYHSPLTYAEMDFNHDGSVTLGEADYASSFGERQISASGKTCIEYFAYKDGLPLKVDCRHR
jgi:hypothetical protein